MQLALKLNRLARNLFALRIFPKISQSQSQPTHGGSRCGMQFAVGFQTCLERGAEICFGGLVLSQCNVSAAESHQDICQHLRLIRQLCPGTGGSVAQDIDNLYVDAFRFGRGGAEHIL